MLAARATRAGCAERELGPWDNQVGTDYDVVIHTVNLQGQAAFVYVAGSTGERTC